MTFQVHVLLRKVLKKHNNFLSIILYVPEQSIYTFQGKDKILTIIKQSMRTITIFHYVNKNLVLKMSEILT